MIERCINTLKRAETTDYIGEAVSQLEHALQAAFFAEQAGHSEAVILASLFHDIGHYATDTQQHAMANLGIVYHEWLGAALAYEIGLSARVALLIGYHVDAKRYLAAKKPTYYDRLSEASKGTLVFQGGPMSVDELNHFESLPFYKEILQVRVNDEKAKVKELKVPGIDYYLPIIERHCKSRTSTNQTFTLANFVDKTWVDKLKNFLMLD